MDKEIMKKCSLCKIEKSKSDFTKNNVYCKECMTGIVLRSYKKKLENLQRINCECGGHYYETKQRINYHMNSKIHKKFLETGIARVNKYEKVINILNSRNSN